MTVAGPFDHEVTYIGLSTDTKPTEAVPAGSDFYETDTGDTYKYSGTAWIKLPK